MEQVRKKILHAIFFMGLIVFALGVSGNTSVCFKFSINDVGAEPTPVAVCGK